MESMFIAQMQTKLSASVEEGELIPNPGRWSRELGTSPGKTNLNEAGKDKSFSK